MSYCINLPRVGSGPGAGQALHPTAFKASSLRTGDTMSKPLLKAHQSNLLPLGNCISLGGILFETLNQDLDRIGGNEPTRETDSPMFYDSSEDEEWFDPVGDLDKDSRADLDTTDGDEHFWQDDGTGVSGLDHELPLLHGLRSSRERGDLGGIITEGSGLHAFQRPPGKWVTSSGNPFQSADGPASPTYDDAESQASPPQHHDPITDGHPDDLQYFSAQHRGLPEHSQPASQHLNEQAQYIQYPAANISAPHADHGQHYADTISAPQLHQHHHQSSQDWYDRQSDGDLEQPHPSQWPIGSSDVYADQQHMGGNVTWPSDQHIGADGSMTPAFDEDWGSDALGQSPPSHAGSHRPAMQPISGSADRLGTLAEIENMCATQHLDDLPMHVQPQYRQPSYIQHEQSWADPNGSLQDDDVQQPGQSLYGDYPADRLQSQHDASSTAAGMSPPNGWADSADVQHQHHVRSTSAAALDSHPQQPYRPTHHHAQSLPSSFHSLSWPAHRAAFDGNMEALMAILLELAPEKQQELDPQGNSVLHIAVLRRNRELVQALLASGFPGDLKNARRWEPVDEAVALRDFELTRILLEHSHQVVKSLIKSKKGSLLETLRSIDDVSFKVKWELGSSIVGPILRRYGPHDTYSVWKRGTKVRVDGTLKGMDHKASVPKFKRGHFSVLFDAAAQPASLVLADHSKQTFLNMTKERKQRKPDSDSEVRQQINEGAEKTKFRPSEFHFKPVRGWLGGDSTEKIEGWKTRVYEATGKMVAITINKVPIRLAADATFEEYLQMVVPEDPCTETQIDPLSMGSGKPGADKASLTASAAGVSPEAQVAAEKKAAAKGAGRKLSARCWMAENFPMSLQQLLPILDIVGHANKHVARAAKFLQKYGELELFPVKLQVPIMYTIYLNSSFQKFTKLAPDSEAMQPGFFDLPPGYRPKTIDEVMQKRQQQAIEAAEQHAADGNDSPLHLDLTEEELHAMQHS